MKHLILCLFIVAITSCSDNRESLKFAKNDFRGTWPFSVNEIEVYCSGYKEIYCIADNGKTYALNGSAKSASRNDKSIGKVEEIWLDNPEFPGLKIPYSEFIGQGLDLCENK